MSESFPVRIAKWAVILCLMGVLGAVFFRSAKPPAGHVKPVAERKAMLDFTLPSLAGGDWRLSDHSGDIVLVNFWASWCPPCRNETPGLVRVAHDYAKRGLTVAGISMDEGGQTPVRKFIRDYSVDYPILLRRADFGLADEIESLPTTILIDRRGRIAKVYIGEVSEAVFRADVELLLRESSA